MTPQTALSRGNTPRKIRITTSDRAVGQKLDLGLRTLKFEIELDRLALPEDTRELMNRALAERQKGFEAKYNLVFLYVQMQRRGSFWEDLGYRSLDELLAALDLPGGTTLALWEVMVRLFSKETFLLVGDEALGYMTRLVAQYQSDNELRRRDYRLIFEGYCKQYRTFDKPSFYRSVNWYVNTNYVEPMRRVADKTKRPEKLTPKGVSVKRVAVETTGDMPNDIRIETVQCSACREREGREARLAAYVLTLEGLLATTGALPPRPQGLEISGA